MTPHEHLTEADKLIEEATGLPMEEATERLTFAQFHIQIASAAAQLGIRDDLGKMADLTIEEADRQRAIRQAAAGPA